MPKSALLIIDMQNDFVLEGAPLRVKGVAEIMDNIKSLLEIFRGHGLPVFHVLRIQRKDGSDVETSRREIFSRTPFAVEGTKGADVVDELTPAEGEYIIRKNRMSAFMNTDLDIMLRSLGLDRVFIAGIQTPNCIRTTVFDAFAYNYETCLVDDAVAAQTPEIHRANVTDMANIGIRIVGTKDVEGMI
jgi:nicotinamidase-related amidase